MRFGGGSSEPPVILAMFLIFCFVSRLTSGWDVVALPSKLLCDGPQFSAPRAQLGRTQVRTPKCKHCLGNFLFFIYIRICIINYYKNKEPEYDEFLQIFQRSRNKKKQTMTMIANVTTLTRPATMATMKNDN